MAGLVLSRKERKEIRQEQAIERNNAYQEQISTPDGIHDYIARYALNPYYSIGEKQLDKLMNKLQRLLKQKKK